MLLSPTVEQIAEVTNGEILSGNPQTECHSVSTDTRTLTAGSLYIPLVGERFDGHEFVSQATDAGAVAVLTERPLDTEITQIKVDDTLRALADLAAWHRDQFSGRVVAVTGSAGKTTVKQLMGSVLAQRYETLITKGNLNNHIGAPLTLLSIEPEHQAAMIELGASGVGEIAYTAELTRPEVGILTNVVPAHLEGFGSIENIAQTKGELIDSVQADGAVILNADDRFFSDWVSRAGSKKVISFGLHQPSDVYATDIQESLEGSAFTLHTPAGSASLFLSLAGVHNVRNALSVAAASTHLGFSLAEIKAGLEQATAFSGRLEVCDGVSGQTIFNDAYNANPESFCAAIDVLALAQGNKILVMGDMGELGESAAAMHERVGRYAHDKGIQTLVATGPLSKHATDVFGDNAYWFETREAVADYVKTTTEAGDTVLVKGSRSAGMDQVVRSLTEEGEK